MSAPPPAPPGEKITRPAVTDWKVQNKDKFQLRARTEEEEERFDVVAARHVEKPSGVCYSSAQLIKGALGAGILGGHRSYMFGGLGVSLVCHFLLGLYMTYCFYLLYRSASILYKRTQMPVLNYSDLGEAAALCSERPGVMAKSRAFRKWIDVVICLDLFASCCAYQLIIAYSIKQLVENDIVSKCYGQHGYPHLRIYLLILIIPFIMIVMIRHLHWLAPFSMAGNCVIIAVIIMTIYYAFTINPKFEGLQLFPNDILDLMRFVGMTVFSMSCSGVVLAVENNMKEPKKFPKALFMGMAGNIAATILTSAFGYIAYRHKSTIPITANFPMEAGPKILKALLIVMIYFTHGLNFWVPFNNVFYYVKLKYPEERHLKMEYLMRGVICFCISLVAITMPFIDEILSIVGTFCLSLMSFIWPVSINLLVIEKRPGFGKGRWRLILAIVLITIGTFIWICGTFCNVYSLVSKFPKACFWQCNCDD